ncbi:hypothetical protein TNCV_4941731 [Trichonephila clavipes]|nr:hypothetical protein TNCV_4941731 [Trichonephila clavipes]
MKSLVYLSPVDSDEALVARIAVVAGEIRETPGVFANVGESLRRRCCLHITRAIGGMPRGTEVTRKKGLELQTDPSGNNQPPRSVFIEKKSKLAFYSVRTSDEDSTCNGPFTPNFHTSPTGGLCAMTDITYINLSTQACFQ